MQDEENKIDFGYERVTPFEKNQKVAGVFHSVAHQYDLMNDLMSFGVHRLWKRFALDVAGFHGQQHILDVAAGTGDLAFKISQELGENSHIILSDINDSMLNLAKKRFIDAGLIKNIDYVIANAEQLPFSDNYFDRIIIGFGLRNVSHKERALASMYRVLKPGGRLIILEFSQPKNPILKKIYDSYSFRILPLLGKLVVGDAKSYQYLAESIRLFPQPEKLKSMLEQIGFQQADFFSLSAGLVTVHRGFKA